MSDTSTEAPERVSFVAVLRNPEFRAMYVAQGLSIVGDQLMRIAMAVLLFARTGSAVDTAGVFAASYLPWLVSGPLLARYADRLPRRELMVGCDLIRCLLVLLLLLPGLPTPVALLVIACIALFEGPFTVARAAMIPDVVGEGPAYVAASTLGNTTQQLGLVFGFAVGGGIVAAIGARAAIGVDSLSFALSALMLLLGVRHRRATMGADERIRARDGVVFIARDPVLRALLLVAWTSAFAGVAPEAVAVPYAAAHHGGAGIAGLLTAAPGLGTVIGSLVLHRVLRPEGASRWLRPLALASAILVSFTAFDPGAPAAFVLWTAVGACLALQIVANWLFVSAVPAAMRGRAFAVAVTGMWIVQGAAAWVAGVLADSVGPALAVGDLGLVGLGVLAVVLVIWPRSSTNQSNGSSTTANRPMPYDEAPVQGSNGSGDEGVALSMPTPSNAPSRTATWRTWSLTSVLAVTALLGGWAWHGTAPVISHRLPWPWLLLLFVVVMAFPLHFEYRRQPRAVQLEAVPLVLGLFFVSPVTLVVVRVLAALLVLTVRRQPVIRTLFNAGMLAATSLAVVSTFRAVDGQHDGVHPRAWLAIALAVVVDEIVANALIAAVVRLYDRSAPWRDSIQVLNFAIAVDLVNMFLAVVTASALVYDRETVWAITVFVVLSVAAFRTYHRLASRHDALDKLYRIARELGPLAADPGDLTPALTQLRRVIRADLLQFVLVIQAEVGLGTVISVRDQDGDDRIDVVERGLSDSERDQLTAPASATAPGLSSWLAARRRLRRFDDRIAVTLRAGDQPMALLTAIQRSGQVRAFDHSDQRLLEAAAEQLGTALEKGRLIESLRWAASRDTLTGLPNLDSLRSYLVTMLDGSTGGVLLLLDIDRFHDINDTLGHDAGDAVLRDVARRLEDGPGTGSFVARISADKFAVALPGQAGNELARLAALAVKSRLDGPLRLDTVSADLRVTIGVARAPEHGTDAATLLRRAEMAMANAKGSSTGIGDWEPSLETDGSRRLRLLSGLRQALVENALDVAYQPKLRLATGEVTGFEALVRWRDEALGQVPPSEFVPIAEASGLIGALTSNVLRPALEACRRWHDSGKQVGVSVNVSARSLDDPVLVGQVAAMLTAYGVDPRWLTIEITESSVMENPSRSVEVLRQLRSLGVRLSIDDFGTGYSSLHYLRGLPVHEVKIDKSFVDTVDGNGADRAVIRAVVELCESLGLTLVAEGVERASQALALEALGVHEVQGFYYGRPMPEADAVRWLEPRLAATKQGHDARTS